MQHATEMAVMSSIQHPNVVAVYSCLTDMVEASPSGARQAQVQPRRSARWRAPKLLSGGAQSCWLEAF